MHLPECMVKGPLGELNTGDPYIYVKHLMDGTRQIKFHVNIIDQLNQVFTMDGMKFLSARQERFMNKFFEWADTVTKNINSNKAMYSDYEDAFIQLDDFLGSYNGVDNGRYTR